MQLSDTLWFSCQKIFSLPTKLMGWVMDLCKFIAVCGMSSYLRFTKDAKHFLLHFLTTWPKLRMKLLSILTLLWLFVVRGSLLWPKNATHEDGSKVGQRRSLLNRENSWQLKTDITKVILLWMILKGKGHHVFLQIFYLFFWAVQVMVWGWERCTNYHKIFLDDFSQPKILHILMRRIV